MTSGGANGGGTKTMRKYKLSIIATPESIKISETTNPDEGSFIQLETLIPIQFEGIASVV